MLMAMFDKSFIHAINEEEAAVFDMHFLTNITPLFFVEVLGDLEKSDVTNDEKRAALVRNLAAKTPLFRSYPNIPHAEIVRKRTARLQSRDAARSTCRAWPTGAGRARNGDSL